MMKALTSFVKLGVLVFGLYELSFFCQKATDGFTILKITSELTPNSSWETPVSLEESSAIFNQKFSYLASGGQAFVFASEDGKYVIKFFKNYLLPSWLYTLPLPNFFKESLKKQYSRRSAKLQRDFDSYKLAFDELKDETGLIYLHLNKTCNLNQKIIITDKLGIDHTLDLDAHEFVVQRRAELVYPYIDALMKKGETSLAKEALVELLKVAASRAKKGIHDEDARFHRNFGFIAGRAIVVDIGRFKKTEIYKSVNFYKNDLYINTRKLNVWLEESYPELALFLKSQLSQSKLEEVDHE